MKFHIMEYSYLMHKLTVNFHILEYSYLMYRSTMNGDMLACSDVQDSK